MAARDGNGAGEAGTEDRGDAPGAAHEAPAGLIPSDGAGDAGDGGDAGHGDGGGHAGVVGDASGGGGLFAGVPALSSIVREDFPSKSAYKKALKTRRRMMQKLARREEEKAEKAARSKANWEERKRRFEALGPEERAKFIEEKRARVEARVTTAEARKKRQREASVSGQNIVIDLEFGDVMQPGEMRSLVHQLSYCYASNRRSEHPCRLSFTGAQGAIGALVNKIPGIERWFVNKEEKSYLEVFGDRKKEDLVYLTADSDNVIEDFDPAKVYIIGGLVDRNRHKGICKKKADEQGIQTAQLPVRENIKLLSSTVLTVNQVLDIYLSFQECKDWEKALQKAIPTRKVVAENQAAEEDG